MQKAANVLKNSIRFGLKTGSINYSKFPEFETVPQDKILKLIVMFKEDPFPQKVNLGAGVYQNEEGPIIMSAVKKAEKIVYDNETEKGYCPEDGIPEFSQLSQELLFGEDCPAIAEKRIYSMETFSGTGALHMGGKFITNLLPEEQHMISMPDPTWGNHFQIFGEVGLATGEYTYFDYDTQLLDYEGMKKSIKEDLPEHSTILLHGCAHNPTGADLLEEQWDDVLELLKEKDIMPFFDCAYLGYKSGSFEKDCYPVRKAMEIGIPNFLVAQSYSKSLGLYGERIGCLHMVCNDEANALALKSQMKLTARKEYSVPGIHGARIVQTILSDEELKQEWLEELSTYKDRIFDLRNELYDKLMEIEAPSPVPSGSWKHIKEQIGFFCFTGLSEVQSQHMINDHHIYMAESGRISVPGLNQKNLDYVANAIKDVVTNY